jgi:hypothetical protein
MHSHETNSPQTFNHGVEGSSPSALTIEIRHNLNFAGFPRSLRVCTVSANALLRIRRALAFPLYATALAMAVLSDLIGTLAAKIAGDD